MQGVGRSDAADFELFGLGSFSLHLGDEAVFLHALDDVELARTGSLGVVDRVIGRGRFGQSGQHGGFGDAQVLDGFAKIGFRCGGKAVSTLAQKNLVQINFKNLVFAQQML